MAASPVLTQVTTDWRDASARGWRLLPLQPRGKSPLVKGWPNLATDDHHQLAAWARLWPDCNWGAATGQASSLLVIDVDGPGGEAALVSHQAEGRFLPDTLTVMTGRGWHHYFKWPRGANIRNSAGALGTGLDVRGEGGYIVIPPSIHPSGTVYEYIEPETPIADAPDWIVSLLTEPIQKLTAPKAEGVISEGKRNSTLTSLAGAMRNKGMTSQAIEAALLAQNQSCQPPLPEAEVRSIVASISRYPPAKASRPDTICLADVEPEAVDWLWEPYIPRKMLTLLSGDPGVGKTALAMALGARLTRGEALYSGAGCRPGNVLYLTTENSASHVLRPRFDALGGDCNRFFLLRGTILEDDQPGAITLADIGALETAITEHAAALLVIDPLQSFLGAGVDAHRANQTRPVLDGLIRLAERTGVAILITRHLSKGVGGSPIYRGMGSVDITGAARCELLVAKDPEDSSRVIMAQSKSNLGPLGASLVYSIGRGGLLKWCGESSYRADDLLMGTPNAGQRSALEEAKSFLSETLSAGPQPSKEVESKAKANGISPATLRRAKAQMGIKKQPSGFGGPWVLALPRVAQDSSESLTTER